MKDYKRLAYWEEIDEESKQWFFNNQHADRNPASADKEQIIPEDECDIMDNTQVPWVSLPEINITWKEIKHEAIHL